MKVNRVDLLKTLTLVQPGLASRELVEQSTSFVFQDGEVMTFNDEISVVAPIDIDLEGAVQGKELHALLSKLSSEEIEIWIEDEELRVKGGRSNSGILLEKDITMPVDEIAFPDDEDFKKLPKNFIDAVRFVIFSAGRDASSPILNNIHVQKKLVETCDMYRATRHDLSKKVPTGFLLPLTAARELVKYDPVEVMVIPGWVHFRTEESVVFSCRTYEDDYPEMDQFFERGGIDLELPNKLAEVLDKAGIFTASIDDEQGERIQMTLTKGKMKVLGRGKTGWFEEEIKVKYKGKKLDFMVNPDFLTQAISKLDHVEVGDSRLKFIGEDFQHVVALMA